MMRAEFKYLVVIMTLSVLLTGCGVSSSADAETQAAIDKEMQEIEEVRAKAREKIEADREQEDTGNYGYEDSNGYEFDESFDDLFGGDEDTSDEIINGSTQIRITKSVDDQMTQKVYQKFYLIPDAIATDFNQKGWEVEIVHESDLHKTDMVMGTMPSPGSILGGLTVTGADRIYLTDDVADICANHEMGHYVDMVFFGADGTPISNDPGFVNIYEKEKFAFDEDYPKSDVHEYFAETFAMYMEYGGDLKDDFPNTYEYIDGIMAPYGGTKNASKHMSLAEKERRNQAGIAELFDFDGVYSEMLNEIGAGLYEGLKDGEAGEVVDSIKNKYDEVKDKIPSSADDEDWEKLGEEATEKANEKLEEIDKKLQETDWEKKGEEIADELNDLFSGE